MNWNGERRERNEMQRGERTSEREREGRKDFSSRLWGQADSAVGRRERGRDRSNGFQGQLEQRSPRIA